MVNCVKELLFCVFMIIIVIVDVKENFKVLCIE